MASGNAIFAVKTARLVGKRLKTSPRAPLSRDAFLFGNQGGMTRYP